MKEKDFLIIGSYNYANRRILHELRELGKQAKILAPERLLPFINDFSKDRMYVMNGDDAPEQITKQNTACIIPRIGGNLQFYAKSIHHIHDNIGIPTTSKADGLLNAQDKVTTVQMLSNNDCRTPKTIAIKHAQNVAFMVRSLGGFPIVGKTIDAREKLILTKGADEIDLVNSGLEETMITAFHTIRDTWKSNPKIEDMRTAGFVSAIGKVGSDYMNLGIFP